MSVRRLVEHLLTKLPLFHPHFRLGVYPLECGSVDGRICIARGRRRSAEGRRVGTEESGGKGEVERVATTARKKRERGEKEERRKKERVSIARTAATSLASSAQLEGH